MRPLVQVIREPGYGPRNYVLGRRVHHGAIGLALIAVAPAVGGGAATALVIAGVMLVVHDRRDFPWLRDQDALFARVRA